ncbi:MAG: hypothetical protein JSV88_21915 [Candidatus Aminicenantes bacterium]|nr:MAG: hypothetical protein JSV88_21915 [Candidatus Aminicenantes bacterium]
MKMSKVTARIGKSTAVNVYPTGEKENLTGYFVGLTGEIENLTGETKDLTGYLLDLTGYFPDLTGENEKLTGENNNLTGYFPVLTGYIFDLTGWNSNQGNSRRVEQSKKFQAREKIKICRGRQGLQGDFIRFFPCDLCDLGGKEENNNDFRNREHHRSTGRTDNNRYNNPVETIQSPEFSYQDWPF